MDKKDKDKIPSSQNAEEGLDDKQIANKEIDQVVSSLKFGRFKEFIKPKKQNLVFYIILLIFIFSLSIFFIFRIFLNNRSLFILLPQEPSLYVYFNIEDTASFKNRILFWQSSELQSRKVNRLFQNMPLFWWNGISYQRDLFPIFKDGIEMALFKDSKFVAKTKISDFGKWADYAGGETLEGGAIRSGGIIKNAYGFWNNFSKPEDVRWILDGQDLYIYNLENFSTASESNNPFKLLLGSDKGVKQGIFSIYIGNGEILDNLNLSSLWLLKSYFEYPLVISGKIKENSLYFKINGKKIVNAPVANSLPLQSNMKDANYLFIQSSDMGDLYKSLNITDNQELSDFENLFASFYNIDFKSIFDKFSNKEGILLIKKQENEEKQKSYDWGFLASSGQEDEELLNIFQDLGKYLFAIDHPKEVEHKLKDGTTLVELRAQTDGLEYEELPWSYKDSRFVIKSLRGQGETGGYFVAQVPSLGIIFGNSLEIIDKILQSISQNTENQDKNYNNTIKDVSDMVSFGSGFLSKWAFIEEILSSVSIYKHTDGSIDGQAEFQSLDF